MINWRLINLNNKKNKHNDYDNPYFWYCYREIVNRERGDDKYDHVNRALARELREHDEITEKALLLGPNRNKYLRAKRAAERFYYEHHNGNRDSFGEDRGNAYKKKKR